MKDPFKSRPDPMVAVAHMAVPILVDRLGGTVTVSAVELAALGERYGGTVGIRAHRIEEGIYRLSLMSVTPSPSDEGPPAA